MRSPVSVSLLVLLCAVACSDQGASELLDDDVVDPSAEAAADAEGGEQTILPAGYAMRPVSDIASDLVVGVPDRQNMYTDLDESVADDSSTFVRGRYKHAEGFHTVGYSGAPSGVVTSVTVNYRASLGSSPKGTAQVYLFDGDRLIGTGRENVLAKWGNFSDTFTGLNVASANSLRTKMVLRNKSADGALRYSQIWIEPKGDGALADAGAPALDSGVAPVDSGTVVTDSGVAPIDSGVGVADSGVAIDSGVPSGADAVLVGAGDIADCSSSSGGAATGSLIKGIPGTVFTAGDNAYSDGLATEFTNCYDPKWGSFKSRTRPAVGNHDYHQVGAAPYFAYFGSNAGDPGKGYYSYDLGTWHIVVVNSNCSEIGGCNAGSAQEKWLRADLAASKSKCTAAIWHHPLFNIGHHGNASSMKPIWQALYDYNADVVIAGHDHNYQRWAPMDANGAVDNARGLRQFIVGMGGRDFYAFESTSPNVEAKDNNTWGVMKFTLKDGGYNWQFVPVPGKTFADSGSGTCH